MEVETIVKSRIGKFDKATASNWHLLGIQLNQIIEYYKIKQWVSGVISVGQQDFTLQKYCYSVESIVSIAEPSQTYLGLEGTHRSSESSSRHGDV